MRRARLDRRDPRDRALVIARQDPPFSISPEEAVAAVEDFLASISYTCPDCPPS
jgi:hypothetical protein